MLDFASLSPIVTIPLFIAAAVVVWIASVKIARYANVISDEAGLGRSRAFLGTSPVSDLERLK